MIATSKVQAFLVIALLSNRSAKKTAVQIEQQICLEALTQSLRCIVAEFAGILSSEQYLVG
ncbi:hypothetical protein T07_563 [Trichinella nelsoni]|uniref:Uncharacterized protein n=1 Tax=Trichinella nelsoni TaxID=6336 RepID=A0A0V0RL85_9BILA|nr:hypothetical protein T07_563 [Trichinella nelsoni]